MPRWIFPGAVVLVVAGIPWTRSPALEDARPDGAQLRAWVGEAQGEDPVARERAVSQLIAAGDAALPWVQHALREPLAPAAEVTLRRIHGGLVGISPELLQGIHQELERVRQSEDPGVVRSVARWLVERGPGSVRYALSFCARHPGHAALTRLAERTQTLDALRRLEGGDNVDDQAAQALVQLGASVVDDLAGLARDGDLSPNLRLLAADRLVYLGGGKVFDAVLPLAGDGDPRLAELVLPYLCREVTDSRFQSLAATLHPLLETRPALAGFVDTLADRFDRAALESYLDSKSTSTLCLAARLLGQRRSTASAPRLLRLLRHSEAAVVAAAVQAMGRLELSDHLGDMARTLAHDEAAVRRAGVLALMSHADDAALGWVTTALRDPDPSVRATAASALGRSGKERAIPMLMGSLADRESVVVAAATESLSRLSGSAVAEVFAASTHQERKRAQERWESWWQDRTRADERGGPGRAASRATDEEDLAGPLAGEGERILRELSQLLHRDFRPYGALKDKGLTRPTPLLEAARRGMLAVLDRGDEEAALRLQIAREEQAVIRHFLRHGEFPHAADLAGMLGRLPLPLSAQDYILLTYEAAQAMTRSLEDRFTRLSFIEDASGRIDPEVLPSLFGKGKTLGLMLDHDERSVQVEFVMALSPADRVGLRPGDRVIAVNGKLSTSLSRAKLEEELKEQASLSVLRDGWTRPVVFDLVAEVPDPDRLVQTAMLPGNIGYLRLQQFELGCAQKVEWALRELEGRGMQGLIFDLRGNPGGTVLDAVAIVDKFVPAGEVITTTWTNAAGDGEDHVEEVLRSTDSVTDRTYPLAVLVSRCSASASEMTSGSLQDLGRAVVVGRTTWGKGIGQSGGGVGGFERPSVFGDVRIALSLSITVLEYFLPSGRSIQGTGVEPDESVAEVNLLGERFEGMRRVRHHAATFEYVRKLVSEDAELARELARFDGWDLGRYPGSDALSAELRAELSPELVRRALRAALRAELASEDPRLEVVDVQEDEDVRAAVRRLAESMELDLASVDAYEDLAD